MIKISYILLFLYLTCSCKDTKETSSSSSPRIKKSTRISSPKQHQTFVRGASIPIVISAMEDFSVDSTEVTIGGMKSIYYDTLFEISIPTKKIGSWRLLIKTYSKNKSETHYRKIIVLPENAPKERTYLVQNTFPHNINDYTQGLLVKDGFLYESTGQRGSSFFKKKELLTGKTLKEIQLSSELFGEGLAWINNEFYQLTWTSGKGFVYDDEMEQTRIFNYQGQGWGLTAFKNQLILTDETEKLYFVNPKTFAVQSEIEVYDNQGKVEALNELEVIDNLIYANVYHKNYVVVISPKTGEVLEKIDFSGLLTEEEARQADVLNGIALDSETGKLYVTGKLWPKLFEVIIKPKSDSKKAKI